MEDLKTLIWGFTFGVCIAYLLIGAIEFIIDKIKHQKKKKQIEKAFEKALIRLLREQEEQRQKQEFLKSIEY